MRSIDNSPGRPAIAAGLLALLTLTITGCGGEAPSTAGSDSAPAAAAEGYTPPDGVSEASEDAAEGSMGERTELPVRVIPNIPHNAEAYYAPDNLHVIAQTQDPDALKAEGRSSGALTYTFTDTGEEIVRINDHCQEV